jgi:hypothetical protein
MLMMEKEQINECKRPISEVFVLDTAGIPIIARHYNSEDEGTDSVLLGGFFSAIEVFAQTASGGRSLTDIGMEGKRFYFKAHGQFLIIFVEKTQTDWSINQDRLKTIKHGMDNLMMTFDLIVEKSIELDISIDILLMDIEEVVDSMIFEASLEYNLFDDEPFFGDTITKGKNIDFSSISNHEFTEKIRSVFITA